MNKSQEANDSEQVGRLLSALRDMRAGRDPYDTLVSIVAALIRASKNGALEADGQLTLFPKNHHVGYSLYGKMQDAFLLAGRELGLPIVAKTHPGGTTSYAVLEHPRLRVTLGKVSRYHLNPRLHPFRRSAAVATHRPWQMALIEDLPPPDKDETVVVIAYGYERTNRLTPAFVEARFVANDHYLTDCFDLLALYKQAKSPAVESIASSIHPPLKKREKRHGGNAKES